MKNRIFKYSLFVILVLAADQLVGTFIAHFSAKQVRDNRVELLLNKEINSEIIILGSSRALNNYNPEIISATTGLSCYNLGVSGSNILFHETMLDLVIQYGNQPKMIIYNIDDYGTLFKMDGVIYRKDVLYPYVDNGLIHKNISRETKKNEIASMLMKTYRQNVNFNNAIKYFVYGREAVDYKTTNFDKTGANILVQRPEDPIPVFGTETEFVLSKKADTLLVDAFKRIQRKCLENNVELVLVIPPLFKNDTKGFKEMLMPFIEKNIFVMDLTGTLQEAKYFYNKDHMNREGARLFSNTVAETINKRNF